MESVKNQELEYLDEILYRLKISNEYSLTFDALFNEVSGYKFQHDYYAFLEKLTKAKFITNHNLHNKDTLSVACNYLLSKNFILLDNNKIRLSFEGLVFISRGGYMKENQQYHYSLRVEKFTFYAVLLSVLLSLLGLFFPSC